MAGHSLPLPPTTFPASEQRLNSSNVQNSKRRRFQVPITRYFSESGSFSTSSYDHATLSPPLSDTIQSNLLTVGMRIRKSVPEGYKTTLSKHAFSDSQIPTMSTVTRDANTPDSHTSLNQLAPYCGLHKIGGLAVQPLPNTIPNTSSAFSTAESSINLSAAEQDEGTFSFPSSQESSISTASDIQPLPRPNNKRLFDDEDEDEDDGDTIENHSLPYDHFNTTAPAQLVELHSLMRLGHHDSLGRPIAKPRAPRQSQRQYRSIGIDELDKTTPLDQENRSMFQYMPPPPSRPMHSLGDEEPDFDFGEATFLKNREDVDMDMGM